VGKKGGRLTRDFNQAVFTEFSDSLGTVEYEHVSCVEDRQRCVVDRMTCLEDDGVVEWWKGLGVD